MFKMDKQIRKDPYCWQCAANVLKENSDTAPVFLSPLERGATTTRIFVPVQDGRAHSFAFGDEDCRGGGLETMLSVFRAQIRG
jgi:hypothetical protein